MDISLKLTWRHRLGEFTHCLARCGINSAGDWVVLISEVDRPAYSSGAINDMPGAATALVYLLQGSEIDIPMSSTTWVLHHGEFSSPDAWGAPEVFEVQAMHWTEGRFTCQLGDRHELHAEQSESLFAGLVILPVEQAYRRAIAAWYKQKIQTKLTKHG